MQHHLPSLRKQGLGVAAISYDRPEVLADFARRRGITFPLLSDPGSAVIRAFGIFNAAVPPDSFAYGIPHPGTYLVDRAGKVKAKFFEEDYTQRYTASDILVREFGVRAPGPRMLAETRHLRLRCAASAAVLRSGQRFALTLELDLKPGMHLYAPGVQGYRPVAWTVPDSPLYVSQAFEFPPSRILHLPAIGERVPIYQGKVRLVRELTLAKDKELAGKVSPTGELTLESSLTYQACDDKICYLPETIPLRVTVRVEGHDRERVPPALRRQPRAASRGAK